VHHQLRMTRLRVKLEDQRGFEIFEDGQNRASSVANFPTTCKVGRLRKLRRSFKTGRTVHHLLRISQPMVGRTVLVRLKRAVTKLKCLRLIYIFLNFIQNSLLAHVTRLTRAGQRRARTHSNLERALLASLEQNSEQKLSRMKTFLLHLFLNLIEFEIVQTFGLQHQRKVLNQPKQTRT
jgi:hypothetical protein